MRDLKYYKELHYRMVVEFHPEDNVYFVSFPELPGCIADGKTPTEAVKRALNVKDEWLEVAIESGWKIPEPSLPIETSGRITLRLPKSIHEKLVDKADREEVSLNQMILTYVVEGLERTSIKENIEQISETIHAGLNTIQGILTSRGQEVYMVEQASGFSQIMREMEGSPQWPRPAERNALPCNKTGEPKIGRLYYTGS
ncbi:MAG: type II toxin-antitoxin system HicB family antitoxin [Nitrospirae bacterium]|nr:type II toxin-antitoxin system HicB family antitoxin [Nitrospirota bacterium]